MTKAELTALKNALLASGQPITAAAQHRPYEQNVIDELYNAQSRGNVLANLDALLSLMTGDEVLVFRAGVAAKANKDLFVGVGSGVTDGDKVGVQVSDTGATWLPSDFKQVIVSTTGSTITLAISSKESAHFWGSATFATPKTITITGDSRATEFTFVFDITSLAATLDFGPNARVASSNTVGIFIGGVFTAFDVGLHMVKAEKYGGLWLLNFSGVYSVGDAPPEPPDPPTGDFVEYDDDSTVFYDDDTTEVEYEV